MCTAPTLYTIDQCVQFYTEGAVLEFWVIIFPYCHQLLLSLLHSDVGIDYWSHGISGALGYIDELSGTTYFSSKHSSAIYVYERCFVEFSVNAKGSSIMST